MYSFRIDKKLINKVKKEDILNLIIDEYEKRNSLIKAKAGEEELRGNEQKINDLIDRYIDECVSKE